MASRPVDHRDAADAARRLSGVVMSIAGTARGMGRKARKAVGTLRRLIVPPEPEGVPVEIVLDTGAYLNWCSERDVMALVLTPGAPDGDGAELTSPAIDAAGPRHGLVDLRELESTDYRLTARTADGERPVLLARPAGRPVTHNEGWVDGARWTIDVEKPQAVVLRRDAKETLPPKILAVGCALGIVTFTLGLLHEEDWTLELRRRGTDDRLVGDARADGTGGEQTFQFRASHWDAARLSPDDGMTRWDAWAARRSDPDTSVRLRWGGSSSADPRVSQRMRASVSCPNPDSATRVRPYWTLDQHLSVEISRLNDLEGLQA